MVTPSSATGHLLPNAAPVIRNYAFALKEAGREIDDVGAVIASLIDEAGLEPSELWPQIFGKGG